MSGAQTATTEKGEWSARCCGAQRWHCAGTSAIKKAGNAGNAREATEGTVAGAPRREWRAVWETRGRAASLTREAAVHLDVTHLVCNMTICELTATHPAPHTSD